MDKKLKTKWIKALTSGKYKQGQAVLKDYTVKGPEHCCLGVLCEVAGVKEVKVDNFGEFKGDYELLSPSLLKEFGISKEQQSALTGMNDGDVCPENPRGRKMKFTTIAKWIAKNL